VVQRASFDGFRVLQGTGRRSINSLRLSLRQQMTVWREHRIELQCSEESMITEIESDEEAKFYDLLVTVMLSQRVKKASVDRVGIRRH